MVLTGIPQLMDAAFPIVVSGPSGVGKTVLCERLIAGLPWTVRCITATTRPRRPREEDGINYFFYKDEEFLKRRDAGGLAEWAEVHGHLYGTPKEFLDARLGEGKSVVLNIDVQGGLSIRRAYPEALLIFLLPPSMAILESRLRRRGTDSDEVIARRLVNAQTEMQVLPQYDYVVTNGDLEEATLELISIVRAERARTSRRWREERSV
jgi:guanylate kinase